MRSKIKGLKSQFNAYPKGTNLFSPSLIFSVFCIPYVISYHIGPIPSFFNEVAAISLGSCLALFISSSLRDTFKIPLALCGPLLLAGLIIWQATLNPPAYWDQRIVPALVLAWFALMIFVFSNLEDLDPTYLDSAAWGLWAAALATSTVILAQKLGSLVPSLGIPAIFVSPATGGYYGNIAQVNHAAALLALGAASAVLLFQRKRINRVCIYFSLGFIFWAGTMTGSKGFLVYTVVLLILGLWFRRRTSTSRPQNKRGWPLLTIVALAMGVFIVGYAINLRGFVGVLRPSLAFYERGPAMMHAWRQFVEHPWIGFGWSQYSYGVYLNSSAEGLPKMWVLGLTIPNHCHNLIFQLMAIAGGTGLVFAFCTFAPLRWRELFKDAGWNSFWLLGVLAVLLLFSQWEYPLWYSYFLLPLALVLGFSSRSITCKVTAFLKFVLLIVPIAINSFLLKHSMDYIRLTVSLERLNTTEFGKETVATLSDLQRHSLFPSYVEWFCPGILTPENVPLNEQIATCERMLRTMPIPEAAYKIPLLFQRMNKPDQAILALEQAQSVFPFDLEDYLETFKSSPRKEKDLVYLRAISMVEQTKQCQAIWTTMMKEFYDFHLIDE